MAKSDPTKWLERAAHIRGLGRGVRDRRMAPMFEKLAARLEEIAIAKAEAEMQVTEANGAKGTEEAAPAARTAGPQRRGKSGGKLDVSTRSDIDEHETPRRPDRRTRPRP
jgi:hypothetical protein